MCSRVVRVVSLGWLQCFAFGGCLLLTHSAKGCWRLPASLVVAATGQPGHAPAQRQVGWHSWVTNVNLVQ